MDETKITTDTAILVLSHEMDKDGAPTSESARRLARAVEVLKNHEDDAILITSGWGYRDDTDTTLAEAMANSAVRDHGLPEARIISLDRSRDTVGDALFFGLSVTTKKLIVVTSEFHRARAEHIFPAILGQSVEVSVIGVGEPADSARQKSEVRSLAAFKQTFDGITPGDLRAIEARLLERHPLYNGALDAQAFRQHD